MTTHHLNNTQHLANNYYWLINCRLIHNRITHFTMIIATKYNIIQFLVTITAKYSRVDHFLVTIDIKHYVLTHFFMIIGIKHYVNSVVDTLIVTILLVLSAILSYICIHSVILCSCIEWLTTIVGLLPLTEYLFMFTILFLLVSHIIFVYLYIYVSNYCNRDIVLRLLLLSETMYLLSLLLLLLAMLFGTICVSDWLSVTSLFTLSYAFTKCAISPFTTWLPATMSVPTSVSTLVHNSTLVRAGVIVTLRLDAIQHVNHGLLAILYILAIMYVSISASVDNDIKVIVAWSTVSQVLLTLLFVILGLQELSWLNISLHVAYKSSLFISVGSVLYHFYSQQDVRMSSLLWLRIVAALCTVSMLCISSTIGTIGWTSKDVVLAYCSTSILLVLVMSIACCSVIMTSVYSLWIMVWWGNIQNVSMLETLCALLYVVLVRYIMLVLLFFCTCSWIVVRCIPVAVTKWVLSLLMLYAILVVRTTTHTVGTILRIKFCGQCAICWRLQMTIVTKYDKTVRGTYCCVLCCVLITWVKSTINCYVYSICSIARTDHQGVGW